MVTDSIALKINNIVNSPYGKVVRIIASVNPAIGVPLEFGLIGLEEYLKRCCNKQQIETINRLAEISGNKLELIKNPKQQKLLKDIIDNALQTVDSEKIDVLLQIYDGAINCEDDSIEILPIEQIVRIIRDISYTELLFLKKYSKRLINHIF